MGIVNDYDKTIKNNAFKSTFGILGIEDLNNSDNLCL